MNPFAKKIKSLSYFALILIATLASSVSTQAQTTNLGNNWAIESTNLRNTNLSYDIVAFSHSTGGSGRTNVTFSWDLINNRFVNNFQGRSTFSELITKNDSKQIAFEFTGSGNGRAHHIKTRHSDGNYYQNAIDFVLWDKDVATTDPATTHVMTLSPGKSYLHNGIRHDLQGVAVGIGTEQPVTTLHVKSDAVALLKLENSNATATSQGAYLEVSNPNGTRALFGAGGAGYDNGQTYRDIVFGNWTNGGGLRFYADGGNERMFLASNGDLELQGTAQVKELRIRHDGVWPDYVFKEAYDLRPLEEVKTFIAENGHLPEVPSAAEVSANEGYNQSEINAILLRKIEELTLYVIDLKEENQQLLQQVNTLQKP